MLPGPLGIVFFHHPGHRYWRRQAQEIAEFVTRFSETAGFIPTGQKVRSNGGRNWEETGHDLDRVFERDGIGYGTEIKNTLKYIPREELTIKVAHVQASRIASIVHRANGSKELHKRSAVAGRVHAGCQISAISIRTEGVC